MKPLTDTSTFHTAKSGAGRHWHWVKEGATKTLCGRENLTDTPENPYATCTRCLVETGQMIMR
jgi:hypothetical protein